ncbi:MAG: antibiotic biosynthesis monooxygenase family protein [Ilumatobacteraceae bacterium]
MAEGYRSIIWFRTKPGMGPEFEAAFIEAGMLARPRAVDGYLGAELLRSVAEHDEYYVIGRWASPTAYADWQAIASRDAPREALVRMSNALADHRAGQLLSPCTPLLPSGG